MALKPTEAVDARHEELVALCAELVAAPSPNPPGDVRGPAHVIARYLRSGGLKVERLGPTPEKPNIVATVEGAAPGRHLVLNGHLDTIPAGDPAHWGVPISELVRHDDGRLTGLGIGNMKAGTAALALATLCLSELRESWPGRLSFTAVGDEVTFGPDGAAWLLENRPDLSGDALICAEGPGSINVAIAEKGLLWVEIEATAAPSQGMTSRQRSGATARLAAVVAEIDSWNELRAIPPEEIRTLDEDPAHEGLRLSANCGTLRADGFISQVATRATAEIDLRIPPGLTLEDIEARLDMLVSRFPNVNWRRIKGWDPSWTKPEAPICRALADSYAARRGMPPKYVARLPASDAARWRARGVPALCFGPQPRLTAGIDDYVLERDLFDCAAIYFEAALGFLRDT